MRNSGIVRGISVRSRGLLSSIAAGLRTIDGKITILTELCENTREAAYELMT